MNNTAGNEELVERFLNSDWAFGLTQRGGLRRRRILVLAVGIAVAAWVGTAGADPQSTAKGGKENPLGAAHPEKTMAKGEGMGHSHERCELHGGKVTMTAGVYALPDMVKAEALKAGMLNRGETLKLRELDYVAASLPDIARPDAPKLTVAIAPDTPVPPLTRTIAAPTWISARCLLSTISRGVAITFVSFVSCKASTNISRDAYGRCSKGIGSMPPAVNTALHRWS